MLFTPDFVNDDNNARRYLYTFTPLDGNFYHLSKIMYPAQQRNSKSLLGKAVLVTRPRLQARQICAWIKNAGGQAVLFPLLKIAEPEDIAPVVSLLRRLDEFDMAIFISPNAVRKTARLLEMHSTVLPERLQMAAIGQQTAKILRQDGHRVDIAPRNQFNSEAFLALPDVQELTNRRIIIFRGVGGRELLGDTLTARGAQVVYAEVYRRTTLELNNSTITRFLKLETLDFLTLTSTTAVQVLHDLIIKSGRQRLFKTCLLVGSIRMAQKARKLGFKEIELASDPSDAAMFKAILNQVRIGELSLYDRG